MIKSRLIKIVISIILLILVGYGLFKYLTHPYMIISVKYKEVPPVIQRFPKISPRIYYRGYNVGTVSKIALSDDQKYIVFHMGIRYKNLKLPKNIKVYLNSEDLYGSVHLYIKYPENPSSKILADGDTIYGTAAYERVDKYLVQDLQEGKLGHLISNLIVITDFTQKEMKDNSKFNTFIKNIETSRIEAGFLMNDLRGIVNDPQLKQVMNSSSRTFNNVNQVLETRELRETIISAPESIDKTINNLTSINENFPKTNENITKVNRSISEVNKTVSGTNSILSTTNCNLETINCKVPVIPSSLLENADKLLKTAACLSNELIEILSKRFLILRFTFGKPGSSLKKCKQGDLECLKSKNY